MSLAYRIMACGTVTRACELRVEGMFACFSCGCAVRGHVAYSKRSALHSVTHCSEHRLVTRRTHRRHLIIRRNTCICRCFVWPPLTENRPRTASLPLPRSPRPSTFFGLKPVKMRREYFSKGATAAPEWSPCWSPCRRLIPTQTNTANPPGCWKDVQREMNPIGFFTLHLPHLKSVCFLSYERSGEERQTRGD